MEKDGEHHLGHQRQAGPAGHGTDQPAYHACEKNPFHGKQVSVVWEISLHGRAGRIHARGFRSKPECRDRVAEVPAALAGGLITMEQDGIFKALDGITSLEEVLKTIRE